MQSGFPRDFVDAKDMKLMNLSAMDMSIMCNLCTFGDAIQGIGIGALFMKTFQFLVGTKVSKLWLACSVTPTRRYVTERKS